jgi:hypothetical protein
MSVSSTVLSRKLRRSGSIAVVSLALVTTLSGCGVFLPGVREDDPLMNCRRQPSNVHVKTCLAAEMYGSAQRKVVEQKRSGARSDMQDECDHAPLTPMVRAGAQGIASHSFQPLPNRETVERVRLENDLAVVVSQRGCAHYVLTYLFETGDAQPPDGTGLVRSANALLSRLAAVDPESVPQELQGIVDTASYREAYAPGALLMGTDTNSWAIVDAAAAGAMPAAIKVTYEISF